MSKKPAEVTSKEKNEYIPSFITKKPFWVPDDDGAATNDYLEHQRLQKGAGAGAGADQFRWYDRGKKLGPAATKFRKGACENCGAMGHKKKDCLSRPRRIGAKWSGMDIQADRAVQDVNLGWDAKRDRWNGYDAGEYRQVIEDYNVLEELKKKAKGEDPGGDGANKGDGEAEEAKYAEESDMGRQQSTATRNLRLREDTAKYLLNLDLDSAKYDPKTRSMVDMGAQVDQASALVAEDNFMRASGDAAEFEKAQRYAWETQERGDKNKVHIQANPTSGEYFQKKEREEAAAKKEANRKMLLEKYGGEQHFQSTPLREAAVLENETYVEYDETGAVKGAPKAVEKSKYPEDVYINNHTSVWGSWWKDFKWGYACCHSTVKNSYCTGEEGREAFETADRLRIGDQLDHGDSTAVIDGFVGDQQESLHGSKEEDKKLKSTADPQTKKRTLAELQGGVTEEELDAYKRSRSQADDPMSKYLGKGELVH